MKVSRDKNEGLPKRLYKQVEVHGMTIDPTAEVEIPDAGLNIEDLDLENFNGFRIFGADNDEILTLTDQFPVGQKVYLINTDAYVISVGGSYDVNGASSGSLTIASSTLVTELFRVDNDNLLLTNYTAANVDSAPVPA